ncbi:hypothetical protein AB8B12_22285, partial [Streptomyces sp. PGLac3x]
MSDEDGELFYLPGAEGGGPGEMPGLPPPRRPAAPPETPEETTMELPVIPERVSAAETVQGITVPETVMPDAPARTGTGVQEQGAEGGAGALMVAAPLAVALAALRGMASAAADRRQRRMAEYAAAAPLREARMQAKVARLEQAAKHTQSMRALGDQAREARAKAHSPSGAGGSSGG